MNLRKNLLLNELLIQREDGFLRVHQAEQAIARILDGQYPIPPPPDLPSNKGGAKTNKKAQGLSKSPPRRVRTLNPGEIGYLIQYQQGEDLHTDTTADRKILQWLTRPESSWEIRSIKTIDFSGKVQEILFEQT